MDDAERRDVRARGSDALYQRTRNNRLRALSRQLGAPIELAPNADARAYERAHRQLIAALPGAMNTALMMNCIPLIDLLERELQDRGPDAMLAVGLLRHLLRHPVRAYARRALEILAERQAPGAHELLAAILHDPASPLRRDALAYVPRPWLKTLLPPLLDDPDPGFVHAVLTRWCGRNLALERDQILRLLLHDAERVRHVARFAAYDACYIPPWPDFVFTALRGHPDSIAVLRDRAASRGYRYGVPIPSAITARPFTDEHRAAFLILRAPPPERRALARRLHRLGGPTMSRLADQLDAAERAHQQQRLLKTLLRAAWGKQQRHRLLRLLSRREAGRRLSAIVAAATPSSTSSTSSSTSTPRAR